MCRSAHAAGLSAPAAFARCPGWSKRAHTVVRWPPIPGRVYAVYMQEATCSAHAVYCAVHMLCASAVGAHRYLFIPAQELRSRFRLGLGVRGGGRGCVGVGAQRVGTTLLSCRYVWLTSFRVEQHSVEHAAHDGHAGRKRSFGQGCAFRKIARHGGKPSSERPRRDRRKVRAPSWRARQRLHKNASKDFEPLCPGQEHPRPHTLTCELVQSYAFSWRRRPPLVAYAATRHSRHSPLSCHSRCHSRCPCGWADELSPQACASCCASGRQPTSQSQSTASRYARAAAARRPQCARPASSAQRTCSTAARCTLASTRSFAVGSTRARA